MKVIISDEHCGGHAEAIFRALKRLGYVELLSLELKSFDAVGLREGTGDEAVWRFCQDNGYLLLTGNRTTKDGQLSLELTVRRLLTPTSLPVITIADLHRVLSDRKYCERCAERLAEIVLDLEERHLGITRLYI